MTSEHYDVIIIGTGAGGGTLAHRLAPSGKRILLLERGGYLPREPENWDSEQVFLQGPLPLRASSGTTRTAALFKPHQQYFVGGNTKFYGAILFRLRERDFGEVRHYGGISPAWPISYDGPRAVLRRGRAALPRPRRGRRGPDRAAALGAVPVSGRLARAAHPAARTTTSRAAGHHPFHLPVGVDLNESDPEAGPLRALRPLRRLPLPHRRQGRRARALRAAGARARQRHADHARQGRAARDGRRRDERHRGRRRAQRRAPRPTAPTSSSSPAARSTRRRCCCARPPIGIRTDWRTPPTWSAATTWPTSTRA